MATPPPADGIAWTKHAGNPVMDAGAVGTWDARGVGVATVIKTSSPRFVMRYTGYSSLGDALITKIGQATSLAAWVTTRLSKLVGGMAKPNFVSDGKHFGDS